MKKSDGNIAITQSWNPEKLIRLLDFEWDLKFYFLHMKSNEVGTTLKHPESFHGNVKNLRMKMKIKENVTYWLERVYFGQKCKNLVVKFIFYISSCALSFFPLFLLGFQYVFFPIIVALSWGVFFREKIKMLYVKL